MSSVIRFNLFDLWKQLERLQARSITAKEIAEKSGIHRNTIDALSRPGESKGIQGVHLKTLASLYDYFKREGLDLTVGDFFLVVEGGAQPHGGASGDEAASPR